MYFVYIIKSQTTNRYYIGHTENLEIRINNHNAGYNKSTKSSRPWELVYSEKYLTRNEAMQRELYIKKKKSRIFIEKLIKL